MFPADSVGRRIILLLFLLTESLQFISFAQSRQPFYSREICLVADNDYLTIEDYYYTAGQDIIYRRLLRPNSKAFRLFKPPAAKDSSKIIVQYHYGLKIFTPYDIDATTPAGMDRPYAGWNFANIGFTNFPNSRKSNQYQVEVGLVGPVSGMESLQHWIHQLTHYTLPKGWQYQIQNELVANLSYSRLQNWRLLEDLDLVSQSSVQAGTGSNKLTQEFTLRLIQFNGIDNSVFANSRLSWDSRKKGRERMFEFFFFGGMGINYVLSNIFIEGSIFSKNKSPFSAPIQPWVIQRKFGLMYSKHDISWSITFYHLSKEMIEGTSHDYASLALAVRF